MVCVLPPQPWQPLGLAELVKWDLLQQLNLLVTAKINIRQEKWLGARSWIRTPSGMHVENILRRHQAPTSSWKHCSISTEGFVKVSSTVTASSLLTILKKVFSLWTWGEAATQAAFLLLLVSPWLSVWKSAVLQWLRSYLSYQQLFVANTKTVQRSGRLCWNSDSYLYPGGFYGGICATASVQQGV